MTDRGITMNEDQITPTFAALRAHIEKRRDAAILCIEQHQRDGLILPGILWKGFVFACSDILASFSAEARADREKTPVFLAPPVNECVKGRPVATPEEEPLTHREDADRCLCTLCPIIGHAARANPVTRLHRSL